MCQFLTLSQKFCRALI